MTRALVRAWKPPLRLETWGMDALMLIRGYLSHCFDHAFGPKTREYHQQRAVRIRYKKTLVFYFHLLYVIRARRLLASTRTFMLTGTYLDQSRAEAFLFA